MLPQHSAIGTVSVPRTKTVKELAKRITDDNELARVSGKSYLDVARVEFEKNIAQIQKANGGELDDESISKRLLSIEDTRPFNYDLSSFMVEDKFSVLGEHPPPPTSASHFSKWCNDAVCAKGGVGSGNLPSMFGFALQRPLMPDSTLQKTLEKFDIDPTLSFLSELRVGPTKPHGRSRRIMSGLIPDVTNHVSSTYRNAFPKGLSLLDQGSQQLEENLTIVQDTREELRIHQTQTRLVIGLNN